MGLLLSGETSSNKVRLEIISALGYVGMKRWYLFAILNPVSAVIHA
jgi:hypothetical protein